MCPTAPFHEAYVAARIRELCGDHDLNVTADPYGNLLVRPSPDSEPPAAGRTIAFCAHMDHPAFEVTEADPLTGTLLGGVGTATFERPVPVRFITPQATVSGRVMRREREQPDRTTRLRLEADGPVPVGTFGIWDVGPFRREGDLLHGPAMDDLAGCAAILAALAECRRRGTGGGALGIFTRAEEVGLIGATLIARQRLLPDDAIVVSLEASHALPGAVMGGGPVIRVGDRSTAFHPDGETLLRRAGARLVETHPELTVQRQLMSGGTCEATAFLLAGYAATGVAFPLGNYHNGGPDGAIAAEYIDRRDLETGTLLLVAAAEEMTRPAEPDPVYVRLETRADAASGRLIQTARTWVA